MKIMSPVVSPSIPAFVARLLNVNPHGWGASTGYMKRDRSNWPALLHAAADVSQAVTELSALSAPELAPLALALGDPAALDPFTFVSVHAPSKGWVGSGQQLVEALLAFPEKVCGFVAHPEALPSLEPFNALEDRLWLENMDRRKNDARTVDELGRFFVQLPRARFCFDIAHARQHDPSMSLAHDLLDAFGDRLAEVHLSSILPDGTHVPVTAVDADGFGPVLERCAHVPWILEAPLPLLAA